jgi:hypothetical protein
MHSDKPADGGFDHSGVAAGLSCCYPTIVKYELICDMKGNRRTAQEAQGTGPRNDKVIAL